MKTAFLIWTILFFLYQSAYSQKTDRITEEQLKPETVFLEALQLKLLDKWEDALKAFTDMEKADPANDVVLFEIAKIYHVLNNLPNAVNYIEKAIEQKPDNNVYREYAMDLYKYSNDIPKLNLQLEHQIAHGKYKEDNFYQLARNHSQMGDFKEAIKVLDRLEKMTGYTKKLGLSKVRIYQREQDKKKLSREMDKLEKQFTTDIAVLQQIATIHNASGEPDKAYETYQKILKTDPEHVGAKIFIASFNSQNNSESQFLLSIKSLIEGDQMSKDEKIKQLIPFVIKAADDKEIFNKLLEYADILQKLYPNDPKVNALHGDIYFNAFQPAASVNYYQKSLVYTKSVFEVWQQLMQALDMTGQYSELEKIASDALDLYPNQAICFYYLGKAQLSAKKLSSSLEYLEEGSRISVTNKQLQAEMKLMMVDAFIQMKKNKQALKLFNELESTPDIKNQHPYFLEINGNILFLQGKPSEAVEKWQEAINEGGNKERIQKIIDSIN